MRRGKGSCQICKRPTSWTLVLGDPEFFICSDCLHQFCLNDKSDPEKVQFLLDAMLFAQKNEISIGLALNVKNEKYSLKEAKRRQYLKNRERNGKSVDIYTIGIRMPGNFGGGT